MHDIATDSYPVQAKNAEKSNAILHQKLKVQTTTFWDRSRYYHCLQKSLIVTAKKETKSLKAFVQSTYLF